MLAAFARLVRERPAGSASVVMACTVDEEFTHTGSSHLAASPHGADLAIVAEPTRLDLVNCHKGAVRWKIRTRGVACHSSTPHLGDNAIYRMAEVVAALAEHAEELARSTPDPVLGRPASRSAGSRGGRASTSCPTGARSRSTAASSPARSRRLPRPGRGAPRANGSATVDWIEFLPPGSTCPRSRPSSPARGAGSSARGRRSPGRSAGPRGHRRPLRDRRRAARRGGAPLPRLRARRHRPGPHQGRMDRAGSGAGGRRRLLPDRLRPGDVRPVERPGSVTVIPATAEWSPG